MSKHIDWYSKVGSFSKRYYNPHASAGALIHPFRLITVGGTGCGKTNAHLDVINNAACFKKIYLVSANGAHEPLWKLAKDKFQDALVIVEDIDDLPELPCMAKKKKKQTSRFSGPTRLVGSVRVGPPQREDDGDNDDMEDRKQPDSQSDEEDAMHGIEEPTGNKQKLIIFEDQVFEGRERKELINAWFSRSRNHNFSVILSTQSWFDVPKPVRLNANYVILFCIPNGNEISRMVREFFVPFTPEQFVEAFKICTAKHKDFMMIDRVTQDPRRRIRHNFDHAMEPTTLKAQPSSVPKTDRGQRKKKKPLTLVE